jgi:hypothetical protein
MKLHLGYIRISQSSKYSKPCPEPLLLLCHNRKKHNFCWVKQIIILHTWMPSPLLHKFNGEGTSFSKNTWRRIETVPATTGWHGGKQTQVQVVAGCESSSSKWTSAATARAGECQDELEKAGAAKLPVGSPLTFCIGVPSHGSTICEGCKILVSKLHPGIKGTPCYFLNLAFCYKCRCGSTETASK